MPAGSNSEWERWGEIDPLFGVANWSGKAATEAEPWSDEEFYGLGESDWADFWQHWQRYGVQPGVCLEIGSGAGRLTRAMARSFKQVHGVDVARGMIERAKPALEGLDVTLHLTDGLVLPIDGTSVDGVFSTHVFQHLDTLADAEANWRECWRVLRPGGTLMVHLPVHLWPAGMAPMQSVYEARRRLGDRRAKRARQRMARGGRPIMRGQSYSWDALDATLRGIGFTDVELSVFRVTSNDGVHPFVLARKPAAVS